MTHPINNLDDLVHQRVRLGILALVVDRPRCPFTELRDELDQTDGTLSKHLGVLEKAGLIDIEKVFEAKRPRTLVSITGAGRAALGAELMALAELMARFEGKRPRFGVAEREKALAAMFATAARVTKRASLG